MSSSNLRELPASSRQRVHRAVFFGQRLSDGHEAQAAVELGRSVVRNPTKALAIRLAPLVLGFSLAIGTLALRGSFNANVAGGILAGLLLVGPLYLPVMVRFAKRAVHLNESRE